MDLKSKIIKSLEPILGTPYRIKSVEEIETVFGDSLRIQLENINDKANSGSILLAVRDEVGIKSKLGAFISLLDSETDDWIDRVIIFKSWSDKNRVIDNAPLPK